MPKRLAKFSGDGSVKGIFSQTPPTAPPALRCPRAWLHGCAWRSLCPLGSLTAVLSCHAGFLSSSVHMLGRCSEMCKAWALGPDSPAQHLTSCIWAAAALFAAGPAGPASLSPRWWDSPRGKPCPHLVCLPVARHLSVPICGHTGMALLCGLGSRQSSPGFMGSLRLLLGSQQPHLFLSSFF